MKLLIILIVTVLVTVSCKTQEVKQGKRLTIGREDM